MSKVMLRLRDLQTGDGFTKEFNDVESTIPWLTDRPRFTEVLGVVFEGITREENDRMRSSMRPLDDDERASMHRLDAAESEAKAKKLEERRKEAEAAEKANVEAAKNADPNRTMEIEYRFDKTELAKTDKYDDRPITPEAQEAVMAWVKERMEWVADRGQTIGQAKVTVYPGAVPKGKERASHGTFIPVTAPPKGQN
ncbi:MAG: hypothetical protein HOV80_04815 [Polyangiaceae bacterium]|nr:hypothetical protein [Polyangiaceae bacterium]